MVATVRNANKKYDFNGILIFLILNMKLLYYESILNMKIDPYIAYFLSRSRLTTVSPNANIP